MFDIGAIELLIVVVVAILVIGPKDMPMAMRAAGRWIGKMRRISSHFRSGLDAMVREAELEDMEKEWKKRNAEIMAKNPEVIEHAAGAEAVRNMEKTAKPVSDTPDNVAIPPAPAPTSDPAASSSAPDASPAGKEG